MGRDRAKSSTLENYASLNQYLHPVMSFNMFFTFFLHKKGRKKWQENKVKGLEDISMD